MKKDKISIVRSYILEQIENGSFRKGEKITGAREIASLIDVSFLKVQQGTETLVRDGILESAGRVGTFVSKEWQNTIPRDSIKTIYSKYPWYSEFKELLESEMPKCLICNELTHGVFEINTTINAQSRQNEYMDLSRIFDTIYPDKSDFFMQPFRSFYSGNKLFGIPFIFSPRVMFYNRELLSEGGCEEPSDAWTWDDFINSIRILKKTFPPEKIFNWTVQGWGNFIFMSGGSLMRPLEKDPVRIDSPETIDGLMKYAALKKEMEIKDIAKISDFAYDRERFVKGEMVFHIAPRQIMTFLKNSDFRKWGNVPMPGRKFTSQATDVICVRKSLADFQTASDFVRLMLSQEMQDFMASRFYAIPVRKSSAFKSIDFDHPGDTIFLDEIPYMTADYNLASPEISEMLRCGLEGIFETDCDIEKAVREAAAALRTVLRFKNNNGNSLKYQEAV
ncbi:MAG: hypothetical protein A2017_08385 [Lentisphaerae bacterium GWF2_44_16]|nr:MAG: hypothetical protein A2017_08385 [Lentisphaerae bacterium GWF2_44_16]